jgi:hypothetical protein
MEQQEKTVNELREEYCAGLESLAQFLRTHEEMPLPTKDFTEYVYGKLKFASFVRDLGTCKKEYSDWYVKVYKSFGPINYCISTSRETVCKKVVTGKKVVPLQPSQYYPEIPEHEEDVVEWQCESILEPEEVKESV